MRDYEEKERESNKKKVDKGKCADADSMGRRYITLNAATENYENDLVLNISELARKQWPGERKVPAAETEVHCKVSVNLELTLPTQLRHQQFKISWKLQEGDIAA